MCNYLEVSNKKQSTIVKEKCLGNALSCQTNLIAQMSQFLDTNVFSTCIHLRLLMESPCGTM